MRDRRPSSSFPSAAPSAVRRCGWAAILGWIVVAGPPAAAVEPAAPESPQALWQGYDPRTDPLNDEVLREWTDAGVDFREVRFDGDDVDGERVRIYGMYAAPRGVRGLPGIMHVHGGGQTVNERWLRFWAGRGYAALSFNWGGEWPDREHVTRYPAAMPQGNHRQSTHIRGDSGMWDNSWMIWTRVCRRALTYLESRPEVDRTRLGAFGVSMGGSLIWNLAVDERVRVGCAIYGAGWDSYRHDEPKHAVPPVRRDPSAEILAWRRLGAPEAYAPLVRFPLLFLSSTNDQHGDMDRVLDSVNAIPAGIARRQGITPRFRHHIGREFAGDLPAWMDHYLKGGPALPRSPVLTMAIGDDGVPVLDVAADPSRPIEGIDVYYGLEHPHAVSRHWRLASSGTASRARAPVMHADGHLFALANVRYIGSVTLTTNLVATVPGGLGTVVATLRRKSLLYGDGERDGGFVPSSYGTDPEPASLAGIDYHPRTIAVDGRPGLVPDPRLGMSTYKPTDPQFRAGEDVASLDLVVAGRAKCPIEVVVHSKHFRVGQRSHAAVVELSSATGWCDVTLRPEVFREVVPGDHAGVTTPLESFRDVEAVEVRPPRADPDAWLEDPPVFAEFRWGRDSPAGR